VSDLEKRIERSRKAMAVISNPVAAADEITSLRQQLRESEARAEMLRQAGNRVINYQAHSSEWARAVESASTESFIKRVQAEAVEDIREGAAGFETDEDGDGFVWALDINKYAQRLRSEADQLERGEGDE